MPKGVVDEVPPFRDDYQLAQVDGDYFKDKLRPKQFLHIDQSECILCEGCVDICPWKCIHYLSLDAIDAAVNVDHPSDDPQNLGFFVVDENECTRCALCIDRCPTNVISLGKFEGSLADQAALLGLGDAMDEIDRRPWDVDTGQRDFKNGYSYGMRW
jgi:ferredoxin